MPIRYVIELEDGRQNWDMTGEDGGKLCATKTGHCADGRLSNRKSSLVDNLSLLLRQLPRPTSLASLPR